MLDITDVSEFIYENFTNVKSSKNNTHWLFRCPYCGDSKQSTKKRRFNIDWNNGNPIFNCFNCSKSGNFYELYSYIKNISIKDAYKQWNSYNEEYIEKTLKNQTTHIEEKSFSKNYFNFDDFLRNNCISDYDAPKSFKEEQYIKIIKKFKDYRCIDYPIYYCYTGKFYNRLIIPVFSNGECIYFQGRSIFKDQMPKYLNPSIEKENIILNLDNFDENEYIIVTEGFLDALSIGNQGTSCIGADINDLFLTELFKYTSKGVIIALDNDERGLIGIKKIIKHSIFNKKLYYFFLTEYKDLNEYKIKKRVSDEEIYDFIINNKKTYFESQLTIKMF